MTQTATKIVFDAATANQRLPLIRSIATSLVEDWDRLHVVCHNQRVLEATEPESRSLKTRTVLANLKEEGGRLSKAIDRYIAEANRLGVDISDLDRGWMHFPAVATDSTDMVLCWRPTDQRVAYWHRAADACTARRAIPPH